MSRSIAGASQVWTHLDGFGRPILTVNSLGVRTRIDRDGCGRVVYASGAYTTGDGLGRGTTTTYDWLGRVNEVSVTDPSGAPAKTTYAYPGTDVATTDAIGRITTYRYLTFGGPGDGRLMSVIDADECHDQLPVRHALGNLTQVDGPGPGVPARTLAVPHRTTVACLQRHAAGVGHHEPTPTTRSGT